MIERRVVVVEDEPMTRTLIATLLTGAGFDTREAATAAEAITLVRKWDPDALVIDLNLGSGPGGAEVIAATERLSPGAALVVLNAVRHAGSTTATVDVQRIDDGADRDEPGAGKACLTCRPAAFHMASEPT